MREIGAKLWIKSFTYAQPELRMVEVGPGGSPVRLYDPKTFIPPVTWDWKPLLMVSNVPHVAADFAEFRDSISGIYDSELGA